VFVETPDVRGVGARPLDVLCKFGDVQDGVLVLVMSVRFGEAEAGAISLHHASVFGERVYGVVGWTNVSLIVEERLGVAMVAGCNAWLRAPLNVGVIPYPCWRGGHVWRA
jgi:hypothetical protein